MAEHGDLDSTEHPTGNRGNHVVYGLNAVADEATRLALAQVAGDDGRIIKQTGSPDSGPYMARGATGEYDYMGAGSPWWKVIQRAQQDFNAIPEGDSQAITIPAINLAEGIPTAACMCQIACSLMGMSDSGTVSALEIYRLTLGFSADSWGQVPWERATTTNEGVQVVQKLVAAGADAILLNLTCSVTSFSQDAATELEFTITDESFPAAGAWKAVLLATRSEFVLLPT